MTLGQRIETILKEQKIRHVDFAMALGISTNYVSILVNDRKNTISDTLAKLIEETYGYSEQWILNGTGEKLKKRSLTADKNEIIRKVQKMSDSEVKAVLAFVDALEKRNKG